VCGFAADAQAIFLPPPPPASPNAPPAEVVVIATEVLVRGACANVIFWTTDEAGSV